MSERPSSDDLPVVSAGIERLVTDIAIKLGVLGLFLYWSMTLIAPFAIILVWAVILTVALYPVYEEGRDRLGGRGWIAATLLTLLGLAVIVGPAGTMAVRLTEEAHELVKEAEAGEFRLPQPPEQLRRIPVVGEELYLNWSQSAHEAGEALKAYRPRMVQVGVMALGRIADFGLGLLHFAGSVLLMGFLFGPGPALLVKLRQCAGRISASHGIHFVELAGATIRNVSRGVVGVAVLQGLLASAFFALFQVPWPGLLGLVVLLLCLTQIGPLVVVLPAILWGWATMPTLEAVGFTLCLASLPVLDSILKPVLMARGLATPMLVILVGVIGGTLSYGLIGLFLGPIVLAVFYELLSSWAGFDRPVQARTDPSQSV